MKYQVLLFVILSISNISAAMKKHLNISAIPDKSADKPISKVNDSKKPENIKKVDEFLAKQKMEVKAAESEMDKSINSRIKDKNSTEAMVALNNTSINKDQPYNLNVSKDSYASNEDEPALSPLAKEKLRFFFEPVSLVKEISPAGKASLMRQEQGE
jgi:hypothetical protein